MQNPGSFNYGNALNMSSNTDPKLNSFFIDSHAHIYAKEFLEDQPEVIRRAGENNVRKILMPNVDHTSIDAMMETESRYPEVCYATMGLHPCSVKKDFQRELYIVEEWLA